MINTVLLIGKVKGIEFNENSATLSLEVKRPYKNENGEYDSDLFSIETWKGSVEVVKEYCAVDKNISIRGRLEKTNDGNLKLIAEKIMLV